MKKKEGLNYFLAGAMFVLLISSVSASYSFKNYSINTNYSRGSSITGFIINASFSNQPATALFTDSFGNSVPLKDLLTGSDYKYNCTFPYCASSYTGSNPQSSKYFTINGGKNKTIGFILKGQISGVNLVSFNVSSNAGNSPLNQIRIDILDNKSYEIKNTKKSTQLGNANYGCYDSSVQSSVAVLSKDIPLCQNITLSEAPDIEAGGWFQRTGTSPGITITLVNAAGIKIKSCNIFNSSISTSGSEAFCDLNTSVQQGNYYICATDGSNSGDYKTEGYQSRTGNCGFPGVPPENETATYALGVKPFYFATPGNFGINNLLPDGTRISSVVQNYISTNYPEGCTNGCYIPIEIISSASQDVNVSSLFVSYSISGFAPTSLSTLYDLQKVGSLVNSTPQILSLGDFFKIPLSPSILGTNDYSLSFNGTKLFTKKISIQEFPMNIYPTEYAAGFPVTFLVSVPSGINVAQYSWNFGDNSSTATSYSPSISHTYNSTGNYTVKISAHYNGISLSEDFTVQILPAKNFISQEMGIKKGLLSSFESQISSMNQFQKDKLDQILGISNISASFSSIQSMNSSASSNADYEKILGELIDLKVPKNLIKTSSMDIPLVSDNNTIDLNTLGKITGTVYPASGASYASYWDFNNVDSKISSTKIIVQMDDGSKIPINFYTITITPKQAINESYYLVFPVSQGMNFDNSSGIQSANGYSYLQLGPSVKTVQFSTGQDLGNSYSFFIAPENIQAVSNPAITQSKDNTWIVVLGILGVIVLGVGAYFLLKLWYNKRYEKYLFPDKNQLYNAIFYITNSIKNGVEESEIRKNLLKSGWKGEQITYLLKKYHGKKTGMP